MTHAKHHPLTNTQRTLSNKGILSVVKFVSHSHLGETTIYKLRVLDGYHTPRYKLERYATRLVAKCMETYLAKRPHMPFDHKDNRARKLLYMLPALKEWATLMPGALALEPIHHPKQKRLPSGRRMDPLTSRIFRHSFDTVGVRTRTLAAGRLAYEYAAEKPRQPINWVSLAGGTSAPTMLMVNAAGIDMKAIRYTNIDQDSWAINVSRDVTAYEGIPPHQAQLLVADIFDKNVLNATVVPGTADIVDLMGIFEYLDEKQSVQLLSLAYNLLKPGGNIIACNMRMDHPQLNLHKRGVGWPHVIQKSAQELIVICRHAGINPQQLTIYQPLDGIYNVMRIIKA